MKFIINILLLNILFILSACDTTDSDIIDSQSDIYARYKIEATKGSKRVKGFVTFYERNNNFFDDYIALRGNSHVDFQGTRMQEVRTIFDRTHYENSFKHVLEIGKGENFHFEYLNNDGETFNNKLKLPSSVSLLPETIRVIHDQGNTLITFKWLEDSPTYNAQTFNKKSSKKVTLDLSTPYSSSTLEHEIKSNPAQILIKDRHEELKGLTLCSYITLKANGASGRTKKTSTYCNKYFDVN